MSGAPTRSAPWSKSCCPMPTSCVIPFCQIDLVLEDEYLLDQITGALARRHPLSARRCRLGTPAAVALLMLVLKHLFHWSFDDC